MPNDDGMTPERIAILRQLTGQQKLRISGQMYWAARRNKKAALLKEHPGWSEEQAEQEIRSLLLSRHTELFEPFVPPLEEFL